MIINSVDNNLNNIQKIQNNTLEKVTTEVVKNNISNDNLSLTNPSLLKAQRSTINKSLQDVNNNMALGHIAENGLKSQYNILKNIDNLTSKAINDDTVNQDDMANKITKLLDQFDAIADGSKIGDKQMLTGTLQDISFSSGENSVINMQSIETKTISNNMRKFLSGFSVNIDGVNSLHNTNQEAMKGLNRFQENFAAINNQLEVVGKDLIAKETDISSANSTIPEIDYSKEVLDFSKNNIMDKVGILASTQANAMTQRNVTLLS